MAEVEAVPRILFLFLLGLSGCCSLRITRLTVPSWVQNGSVDSVLLDCEYEYSLKEDEKLVVKWFHEDDPKPVYQWIPELDTKLFSDKFRLLEDYEVPSGNAYTRSRAIVIQKPTTEMSGLYKCEVQSLEGSDVMEDNMIVYSPPTWVSLNYSISAGVVRVVCEVGGVFPLPEMSLFQIKPKTVDRTPINDTDMEYEVDEDDGSYDVEFVTEIPEEELMEGPTFFGCTVSMEGAEYEKEVKVPYFPNPIAEKQEVLACGHLATILIFLKRKSLYCSMKNLCHLARELNPTINVGGKDMAFEIIFLAIASAMFASTMVVYFFFDAFGYFLHQIQLPNYIPQIYKFEYLFFVLCCFVTSYTVSIVTTGFIYLMSKNIFKAIGDILGEYSLKLKKRTESNVPWTTKAMSDDIGMFKNITLVVNEIEDTFGLFVLILYATIMAAFFNTVSVMLQNTVNTYATISYIVWTSCVATVTVVQMSRYGSYVTSQVQGLKRQMIVCSDELIRSSQPKSTMDVFHYLFEIVMKSQIQVTGYSMFVISYSLILPIISTLITYSVLLLQLDSRHT
ncbi:hypothetical protein JTE90_003610 [Oedothorax gibbosus]|uniref:Ig-like domain-containing protein n=1 Tax=Oedothorax gibbosus TaxID=931172 RepID=A0AAV6VBJ5_9ARAC|nr:hypothetical protein JTE90_003610 [Oedothorax gibbosus]